MQYWTWAEIKDKIESDMDLKEEPDILAEGELIGYLNEAIDKCEQHFIKLPDYFLASTTLNIIEGQKDYDLPDDIYACKIRKIMHDQDEYEVKPLRNLANRPMQESASGAHYRYLIINNKGTKPKLRLMPTPKKSETCTMDYTRNANRITVDGGNNQEVDIPEAMGFIFTYIKWKIELKEKLMTLAMATKEDIKQEREDLIEALSIKIDDENNEIMPETGVYDDHI